MPAKKKPLTAAKKSRSPAKKPQAAHPPARARGDRTAAFEAMLREHTKAQHYELRLYVTGTSPRSGQAIANIQSLCEEYLPGRYNLQVIDIYQQPDVAASEQIIAAPTLVKKSPAPLRRLIGDLSNRDKVLVGLNLISPSAKTSWVKL